MEVLREKMRALTCPSKLLLRALNFRRLSIAELFKIRLLLLLTTLKVTCLFFLFQQITTLVNAKERSSHYSDRKLRAISRVGQSVNIAVERFVTVGEAIADDSDEIRPQMYAACQEARAAGLSSSSFPSFLLDNSFIRDD